MVKRLKVLENKALELIEKYLLYRWTIKFNYSRIFFGKCVFREKTIYLSKLFIEVNSDEEVEKTLLHEIAHALAYEFDEETGHGESWKKYCQILGTPAEEFVDSSVIPSKGCKFKIVDIRTNQIYGYTKNKTDDYHLRYVFGIPDTLGNLELVEI